MLWMGGCLYFPLGAPNSIEPGQTFTWSCCATLMYHFVHHLSKAPLQLWWFIKAVKKWPALLLLCFYFMQRFISTLMLLLCFIALLWDHTISQFPPQRKMSILSSHSISVYPPGSDKGRAKMNMHYTVLYSKWMTSYIDEWLLNGEKCPYLTLSVEQFCVCLPLSRWYFMSAFSIFDGS